MEFFFRIDHNIIFNLLKSQIMIKKIFALILISGATLSVSTLKAGCNNEPDKNNGDCTYSTGDDGTNTYFCENSWQWHDCKKIGTGSEPPTING